MIATDPLSLIFIFCFLLGFGFFLVASLMGGHGHGHAHVGHLHIHLPSVHHAPAHGGHAVVQSAAHTASNQQAAQQMQSSLGGYLNPTSIAIFLLGFGFFGYFFHNLTPVAVYLSVLLAVICGIALAVALLTALSRLFANVEGSTEQDVVDRTGMLGKVSITIPEKGLGEIIYTSPAGMRKSIPARGLNHERLERDLEVVVVNYQNGVAEVDTWEHFMHGEINLPDSPTPTESAQLHVLLNHSGSNEMEMLMHQEQQKE
ncbi:MAG TPA: hypothetical protein VGD98_01960 [Ktedonobacteraceae bacterium]